MEVIPVPFRDAYPFGGGLHCATADIRREGSCEDLFPKQVSPVAVLAVIPSCQDLPKFVTPDCRGATAELSAIAAGARPPAVPPGPQNHQQNQVLRMRSVPESVCVPRDILLSKSRPSQLPHIAKSKNTENMQFAISPEIPLFPPLWEATVLTPEILHNISLVRCHHVLTSW